MKILVPMTRVPDPARPIRLTPGGQLDTSGVQWVIHRADAVALEEAVRLRECGAELEIVAVGIGGADWEATMREALARGADRAILVCDEGPTDPGVFSHFLAGIFQREKADLVLTSGQAGLLPAGYLGLPQVTNIVRLELVMGGKSIRVVCETDRGRERLEVTFPAIVSVHPRLNKPRIISLYDIVKARTKPLEKVDGEEFGTRPPAQVSVQPIDEPLRQAGRRVHSVEELVTALHERGVLSETGAAEPATLPARITWLGMEEEQRTRPKLADARVVVAGGRALRDAKTFEQLLGGLADKLGGAVGASGGAVQAGLAAPELLIGQTGQRVAPDLYIAVGISGVDQHLGGMKDAKIIVAINSDPDAPIFRIADYGLVADIHQAVPELLETL